MTRPSLYAGISTDTRGCIRRVSLAARVAMARMRCAMASPPMAIKRTNPSTSATRKAPTMTVSTMLTIRRAATSSTRCGASAAGAAGIPALGVGIEQPGHGGDRRSRAARSESIIGPKRRDGRRAIAAGVVQQDDASRAASSAAEGGVDDALRVLLVPVVRVDFEARDAIAELVGDGHRAQALFGGGAGIADVGGTEEQGAVAGDGLDHAAGGGELEAMADSLRPARSGWLHEWLPISCPSSAMRRASSG